MGKRTRTSERGNPFRTQIRPVIPAPFLLLSAVVITLLFLLAIPLAARNPAVTLPAAHEVRAIGVDYSRVLAVDGAGTHFLDGRPLDITRLPQAMTRIAEQSPQPVLRIRADERLPYRTIRAAVQMAHQAGIRDVRLEVTHAP